MSVPIETYSNNAQTTTAGSINGSSNPVTFSVASAAAFPSTGQFRIIIDSEILLVTSVAGTSFTASRAQEGTTIASHSSGATLTHVLTAGSLANIVGQFALSDTAANRPAAGTAGRLFFPSDGGPMFRDNGSSWECWMHGMGPFKPTLSGLTAVNQGNYTFSTSRNVLQMSILGSVAPSGDSIFGLVQAVPGSTPWTYTAVWNHTMAPGTGNIGGILMYDSVSTKCTILAATTQNTPPTMDIYHFSTPTTFNASVSSDSVRNEYFPFQMMQIVCDGTTYFYNHSSDFITWTNNRQELVSGNFITPTHIGVFIDCGSAIRSNQTDSFTFYHNGFN